MADITVAAIKVGLVHPELSEVYPMIAIEAITKGQIVYFPTTGGVGVADANASGKQQARGVAINAAGIGSAVDVCKFGMIYGFTLAGDYDSVAYLSDTAGALADAAGTMTVPVGRVGQLSDSAKTKVLYVDFDWVTTWS